MKSPHKVVIEMTASGYSYNVFDEKGKNLYSENHVMQSRGSSKCTSNEEIFDSKLGEKYPDLAGAIDDISFGPFNVSAELIDIKLNESL